MSLKREGKGKETTQGNTNSRRELDSEEVGPVSAEKHHHISEGNRRRIDILNWLADKDNDPALKVS